MTGKTADAKPLHQHLANYCYSRCSMLLLYHWDTIAKLFITSTFHSAFSIHSKAHKNTHKKTSRAKAVNRFNATISTIILFYGFIIGFRFIKCIGMAADLLNASDQSNGLSFNPNKLLHTNSIDYFCPFELITCQLLSFSNGWMFYI